MSKIENWKEYFSEGSGLLDDLRTQLRVAREALIDQAEKPLAHWGDGRLMVNSIARGAYHGNGMEGGSCTVFQTSLNQGTMLHTKVMTGLDQWVSGTLYRIAKKELLKTWPEIDEETLRSALIDLVPHTIRVVACIWDGYAVFTELKYRYSAPYPTPGKPHILQRQVLPSDKIGFPHAVVLPDTGIEATFERLVKMPFVPFGQKCSFEHMSTWSVITPDRPEVLLVRHTEFKGNQTDFYRGWQEEGVYPYVFVDADDIAVAVDGNMTAIKKTVDDADTAYRMCARALEKKIQVDKACGACGKPLKTTCVSVPPKRMLNYDASLQLDEASTDSCLTISMSTISASL